MAEIDVRDAEPGDSPGIARVRTRTWQAAYAHIFRAERLDSIDEEASAERTRDLISEPAPRMHWLVVDGERGLAGFALLGASRDEPEGAEPVGELFQIYVLPDESGRGVGQALMSETLRRLRAEGFGEAVLWVLEDNPRTRRFYELAGWRADAGSKDEEWLGTVVREIRYRIAL